MILSIVFRRGNSTLHYRFGTGGREVMARFYAIFIIVECRHNVACPVLRWLIFSDEPTGFVSNSEPILGNGARYRVGPSR